MKRKITRGDADSADPRIRHLLLDAQGGCLSLKEANAIEKRIESKPDDADGRIVLMGYWGGRVFSSDRARQRYFDHAEWLIQHCPHQPALEHLCHPPDANDRTRLKKAWRQQLKKYPNDVEVIANAAHFMTLTDRQMCKRLWKRAMELQPDNDEFPRNLAHVCFISAQDPASPTDRMDAKQAVTFFKMAFRLHLQHSGHCYIEQYCVRLLADYAKLAICFGLCSDANELAQWLFSVQPQEQTPQQKEILGPATRQLVARDLAYSLLGMLSLREGQLEKAKECFGKIRPTVDPDSLTIDLANELLRAGERENVRQYLQRSRDEVKKALPSQMRNVTPDRLNEAERNLEEWLQQLNGKRRIKLKPW
jgi:hypothetical protein